MRNKVRTLGITAALAVMIPISAYAATTSGTTSNDKSITGTTAMAAHGGDHGKRGGFEGPKEIVSQDVLDLLKLDKAAIDEKIKAGSTLAQIAEAQGVSRDALKQAMTAAFNKKQDEQKKEFADNLDKMIDSNLQKVKPSGGPEVGMRVKPNIAAVATVLGLTEAQLNEQLSADKSLADLAKEKGIEVQKLIDAEKAAITSDINTALNAGKLTQAQADKQLADAAKLAEKIVNGNAFGRGQNSGSRGHGPGGDRPVKGVTTDSSSSNS
jgi:hypothetical protein